MEFQSITVTEKNSEMRLDRFVRSYIGNMNQSKLEEAIRKRLIKVNGKKSASNYKTILGDVIEYLSNIIEKKEEKTAPYISEKKKKYLLDSVLYQDKDMVIINKPVGLAVQGGTNVRMSIDDMLDIFKNCDERPKLTHRLDKETTGVLVIARNKKAANDIAAEFKKRNISKYYLAICRGVPKNHSGYIESRLGDEEDKDAKTIYRVLDKIGDIASLIEFEIITGRKHQIRQHAAKQLGTPIIGDEKYGGQDAFIDGISPKMHLHAKRIIFNKIFGKKVDIKAKIPEHMRESFRVLGFSEG